MAPEQASPSPTSGDLGIVSAKIHPSIGIARIGDSEDEFFLGPEVLDLPPLTSAKDSSGALKRQAARFRVYGYNAAGEPVAELTAGQAKIEWTVHVANKKAAWYEFQIALDIPEAENPEVKPSERRNKKLTGAEREGLEIDPGPRTISGASQSGSQYHFDTGKFMGTPVYLGAASLPRRARRLGLLRRQPRLRIRQQRQMA
jgi:hypothetical protein